MLNNEVARKTIREYKEHWLKRCQNVFKKVKLMEKDLLTASINFLNESP